MAESDSSLPPKITFHYIKSNTHGVYHADGAWGGVTPTGNVVVSFFSERRPIPQTTEILLSADNVSYGEEKIASSKHDIVREVSCTLVMSEPALRSLRVWIDQRIVEVDAMKAAILGKKS